MHIMIDLETMGLGPRPAVVQIGAAPFSLLPDGENLLATGGGFRSTVSLTSSLVAGLEIDLDTVRWWQRQSPDAQASVSGDAVPLRTALQALLDWWPTGQVQGVWSHGAATDVPWLDAAFHACGMKPPWTYRQPRDTRTLFDLARLHGWSRPEFSSGTQHDALDDARSQAADVRSAWLHLHRLVPAAALAC